MSAELDYIMTQPFIRGYQQGETDAFDKCLSLPVERIMGIEYIRKCDVEELKEKRCNSSGM